jgi:hypothetical protein
MIEIARDDLLRRITLRFMGAVTGQEYLARLGPVLDADPALHEYDFIFDARDYAGTVENDHVRVLAERYAPQLRHAAATMAVIVSHDTGMQYWARLLEVQFPNRRFVLAPDLASADRLLAAFRAG